MSEQSSSSSSAVEQMRRLLNEGLDKQDVEVLRDVMGDEVALIGDGRTLPVEAIIANTQMQYEAMPDLTHIIHDIWQDGDTVIARYTNEGTFKRELSVEHGPMAGLHAEPTGEKVEYSGVYLARFDDNEVVEWENHSDRLGAFQQIGLLPDWDELTESSPTEE